MYNAAEIILDEDRLDQFDQNTFKAVVLSCPTSREGQKSQPIYNIGVPTAWRETGNYLEETLTKLFASLEKYKIPYKVTVQIGETDYSEIPQIVRNIQHAAGSHDNLEILIPNPSFYSILSEIMDSKATWRRKLYLDYAHLFLYSSLQNGKYYIHLEDDTAVDEDFLGKIDEFREEVGDFPWEMLEFSTLRFIGKMFRKSDLRDLAQLLFQEYYKDVTAEALLHQYISTKELSCMENFKISQNKSNRVNFCGQLRLVHRPSLVQHVGFYSSWPGAEWTNVTDGNCPVGHEPWPWMKVPIYINPSALISTSLVTDFPNTLETMYSRKGAFLCSPPKKGDTIDFTFTPTVKLEEFFIRTKHLSHPNKGFNTDTYVEILPLDPSKVDLTPSNLFKYSQIADGFIRVGRVNDRGIAEGLIGDQFGKVKQFRIHVTSDHHFDGMIKEMSVKLQLVPSHQKPCCQKVWPDPFPHSIPGVQLFDS